MIIQKHAGNVADDHRGATPCFLAIAQLQDTRSQPLFHPGHMRAPSEWETDF